VSVASEDYSHLASIVIQSASLAAWPRHGPQRSIEELLAGHVSPTLAGQLTTG
jgi:hypothetical protein